MSDAIKTSVLSRRWFLGTMNDALFIIDGPPQPAPDDTGPRDWPGAPNPISRSIDADNGKLIVEAHNAAIEAERAACEAIAESSAADDDDWGRRYPDEADRCAERAHRARTIQAAIAARRVTP